MQVKPATGTVQFIQQSNFFEILFRSCLVNSNCLPFGKELSASVQHSVYVVRYSKALASFAVGEGIKKTKKKRFRGSCTRLYCTYTSLLAYVYSAFHFIIFHQTITYTSTFYSTQFTFLFSYI